MPIPQNDTLLDRAIEILDQVKVNHFTASPENLTPFVDSKLSWDVEAPASVRITLDNMRVEKTGNKTVNPVSTRTYHLIAQVSVYTRHLGSITIRVNQDACVLAYSGGNIENMLKILIINGLKDSPEFKGFYFPEGWGMDMQITNDNFYYKVSFKKNIAYFTDPTVTLSADFSIVAEEKESLLATAVGIRTHPKALIIATHSDVTVPWYAWLVPGALPGLAIALSMARDSAKVQSRNLAQVISDSAIRLIRLYNPIPDGYQLHHVILYETSGGHGNLDAAYCPAQPVVVIG